MVQKRGSECSATGRARGCAQKDVWFVVPTVLTEEVRLAWSLTGPTTRFDSDRWPGPREYPGEYYRGLKHWNPDADLPPRDTNLCAKGYERGSNACSRPYTFCGTCLPGSEHRVFAESLQVKTLVEHEKSKAHRFSFLYHKIMSSSATPEQRAQFVEVRSEFRRTGEPAFVDAACTRVEESEADAMMNLDQGSCSSGPGVSAPADICRSELPPQSAPRVEARDADASAGG